MTREKEPCLVVRGVSNTYSSRSLGVFGKKEEKSVLKTINLEMYRGEIFGLVGESGCGKTTLARCILGLIDYEGEILLGDSQAGLRHLPKRSTRGERRLRARMVQGVFQDPGSALNPVKTLGWILEEPLKAQGCFSQAERNYRIDRMLDLVGLDGAYKKRRPRELSSGQKQRVSIGAALMTEPALLVADEPVSALDVSVGAQVLNLFIELNERLGTSILFISHNMELVHYLCHRIARMEAGQLLPVEDLNEKV